MVSARDWVGARLRIHESLVAERTYEALGARAVVLSMRQMSAGPAAHVDGLDIQTQALVPWGLRGSITYNIDLWPRTIAIVASQRTRRWLGADERAALHTAAVRTLDRAPDHLVGQEEGDRRLLPARTGLLRRSQVPQPGSRTVPRPGAPSRSFARGRSPARPIRHIAA